MTQSLKNDSKRIEVIFQQCVFGTGNEPVDRLMHLRWCLTLYMIPLLFNGS